MRSYNRGHCIDRFLWIGFLPGISRFLWKVSLNKIVLFHGVSIYIISRLSISISVHFNLYPSMAEGAIAVWCVADAFQFFSFSLISPVGFLGPLGSRSIRRRRKRPSSILIRVSLFLEPVGSRSIRRQRKRPSSSLIRVSLTLYANVVSINAIVDAQK